jgi:hypothetical protein
MIEEATPELSDCHYTLRRSSRIRALMWSFPAFLTLISSNPMIFALGSYIDILSCPRMIVSKMLGVVLSRRNSLYSQASQSQTAFEKYENRFVDIPVCAVGDRKVRFLFSACY